MSILSRYKRTLTAAGIIIVLIVALMWFFNQEDQPYSAENVDYVGSEEEMPELSDTLSGDPESEPAPEAVPMPETAPPVEDYAPQPADPLPNPIGPDSDVDRLICPLVHYENPTPEQVKNNPCIQKPDPECPDGRRVYAVVVYGEKRVSDDPCMSYPDPVKEGEPKFVWLDE